MKWNEMKWNEMKWNEALIQGFLTIINNHYTDCYEKISNIIRNKPNIFVHYWRDQIIRLF